MRTNAIPIIETPRLRLRGFQADDADAYHVAIYGDADVMRYLPGGTPRPIEKTRQTIDAFNACWHEHGVGGLAITLAPDDRLIGHCGLMPIPASGQPTPDIELFYAIARSHWGGGLVTEAARAAVAYGFEHAGLDRIVALAVPENGASRRVMEKVGLRFEGLTDRYYNATLALHALSRADWQTGDWPDR